MAILRKVYGPFSREMNMRGDEITWYFHGIRDDYSMGHWQLIYYAEKRKFRAINLPLSSHGEGRVMRSVSNQIGKLQVTNPDQFAIAGSPVLEGRITDILRNQLSEAEIASAVAVTILKR